MNSGKRFLLTAFSGIIALISIRFFSFTLITDRLFDYIEILTLAIVMFVFFLCLRKDYKKSIFGKYITAILGLTLLSSFPAAIFHDQSMYHSLLVSRTVIYWLMFFIIYKLEADEEGIKSLLLVLGVVWSLITVVQQITFPTVYFNFPNFYYDHTAPDMESILQLAEERGGLIRMLVMGLPFGYFIVFYAWVKLNESFSIKYLFIFSVSVLALSLTGSRQIVFSLILIFAVDFFLHFSFMSLKKISFLLFMCGIVIMILPVVDDFLITLIKVTREQKVLSQDYIRVQEINFFLFEYYPHWITYIFGNGWEHSLSAYGQEFVNSIFYRSDVGLIGALNKFGILYVIVSLLIYKKTILPGQGIEVPHYARLLFIFLFMTAFTGANYFENTENIMPFVFVFYLIEKHNDQRSNIDTDL